MSLYLCIFDEDVEIEGWVLGHYSDFGYFRNLIASKLDTSDYPTLMLHSDCDGSWSVTELPTLVSELRNISTAFKAMPPEEPDGAFEHTAEFRSDAKSMYDCFHNVDGENLFDALVALCEKGISVNRAVLFQ